MLADARPGDVHIIYLNELFFWKETHHSLIMRTQKELYELHLTLYGPDRDCHNALETMCHD